MIYSLAPRLLGAASKIVSGSPDGRNTVRGLRDATVRRTLGLAEAGIPVGREAEPADYKRWKASNSEASNAGAAGASDGQAPLAWREFLWPRREAIDECAWERVRWRFYANGLVCFEASMSNTSGRLDGVDVQGHRIELREKSGLLVGVWIAGFFVRKTLPLRGFATSVVDNHQPLSIHFADLEQQQAGAWVCL